MQRLEVAMVRESLITVVLAVAAVIASAAPAQAGTGGQAAGAQTTYHYTLVR